MKVTMKAENKFTLEVGDKSFPNMRLTSRWEGFMKLEGPHGVAIVADDRGPMTRAFDELFEREASGLTVIKASPEIAAALRAAATNKLDVPEPPEPADVGSAEL